MSEKLDIYNEALDKTIKELARKRTELNELAKTTVQQLNAEIPVLQAKVADLQAQLSSLDSSIAARNAEYSKKQEDLQVIFDSRTKHLEAEYSAKQDVLNAAIDKAEKESAEHTAKISELAQEIKKYRDLTDVVAIERSDLAVQKQSFAEEMELQRNVIVNGHQNLEEKQINHEQEVREFKEYQKKTSADLEARTAVVVSKESQCKEILDRVSELDNREAIAIEKEQRLTALQGSINIDKVKVLADIQKNNKRSSDLDAREKQLNERDANLKLLEAKV